MPCLAQASMISNKVAPCLRTVAVLSDSRRWSDEKSRTQASIPCEASTAFMRRVASSGLASRPA